MKIAVRLDDITPDMDWKKFLMFKELLDLYKIKPLIGIVPNNMDPDLKRDKEKSTFVEYVLDLQKNGWVLAMHGYRHVYDSKKGGVFPLNHFSEFAGHTLEEQDKRIRHGKEALLQMGIDTDIFMAPAHSYDNNTVFALKKNGFAKITDGFGIRPYKRSGMCFYPISFRMSDSLKKENGYTTMVVHTNTINDIEYYRELFEKHHEQFIDYSEYLQVESIKQGFFGRCKEVLMANMKRILVKVMK